MKEEFDRKPGLNPASWKYGSAGSMVRRCQQNPHQIFMVNGKLRAGTWTDAGSAPVRVAPEIAESLASSSCG